MTRKREFNVGALRTVVVLFFAAGYLAGCAFPLFRVAARGLWVPGWVLTVLCYSALLIGIGGWAFVVGWFVTKVWWDLVKRRGWYVAFLDFYASRRAADDGEVDA
jgi:hypothetical protein